MIGEISISRVVAASLVLGLSAFAPSAQASQQAGSYLCPSPVTIGGFGEPNPALDPVMADMVRDSAWIALARVEDVEPVPEEEQALHRDGPDLTRRSDNSHRYHFVVEETLKGEVAERFSLLGGHPFASQEPMRCPSTNRIRVSNLSTCEAYRQNRQLRHRAFEEANSGRHGWEKFYFIWSPLTRSGMGPARVIGSNAMCAERELSAPEASSFEVGQSFLIIHDGQGEFQMPDPYGLNYALITREDDAWLAAVRHFASNPHTNHLPPIPLGEVIGLWEPPEIISPRECERRGEHEMVAYSHRRRIMELEEFSAQRTTWHFDVHPEQAEVVIRRCNRRTRFVALRQFDGGDEFVPLKMPILPIIRGKVDFSGMPGPWTFTEGEQIDLDTVMEMAEAAQRD